MSATLTMACATEFQSQGKQQFTHAILFHLAEEQRTQQGDWTESYLLYGQLMDDYSKSRDRRRSFFFLLSELITKRCLATTEADDPILRDLCSRFLEESFITDVDRKEGEWSSLCYLQRTQEVVAILCVRILILCRAQHQAWEIRKGKEWWSALTDHCKYSRQELLGLLRSVFPQKNPEDLLEELRAAAAEEW